MLRPAMNDMLTPGQDCYSFVVGIAKRARQIADTADAKHEIVDEKPVRTAVDEFSNGECTLTVERSVK